MTLGISRLVSQVSIIIAICLGSYVLYEKFIRPTIPERETDGKIVNGIIDAKLEKASDLRVSKLSGTVQSVATNDGPVFTTHIVMKTPFNIDYFVPLSRLSNKNFFWNDKAKVLTIQAPEPRPEKANIDEANATLVRMTGYWVSRSAMIDLRKRAATAAEDTASAEALKPVHMKVVEQNAERALLQLFEPGLRAAIPTAQIRVDFVSHMNPDAERWDIGRSIHEIYAE